MEYTYSVILRLSFGWLVVFFVPSTARSFRDGTPIYCPLRRTRSSVNTPFPLGIEPGPSRGSPLLYRCATQAPYFFWTLTSIFHIKAMKIWLKPMQSMYISNAINKSILINYFVGPNVARHM